MKIASNLRIEARAARGQVPHLLAQSFVDLAEQNPACVDSHLAQPAVQRHKALEYFLRERPSLRDFLENALVDQVIKLWHHGKGRDIAFAQSPQKFCGVERLQ